MRLLGKAWNEQIFPPCGICSEGIKIPHTFFCDRVCDKCYGELRKLTSREMVTSRLVIIYYILQQARFIKKLPFQDVPHVLERLDIEDLRELAWLLIDITGTDLF